jgi:CubicO group peptidase (beta-lactamase class C family)
MLGLLINKATGVPYHYRNYETYIQQNILAPIGITDMQIGDTLFQNRAHSEVKYYTYRNQIPDDDLTNLARIDGLPYSNSQILKRNFGDGGWIASSIDLAKFLQAVNNNQILSSYMVKVMLERPTYQRRNNDYFAMGCSVKHFENHSYWAKTGSFTGTYAVMIQSDDDTSYVALFNIKPTQRQTFLAQLRKILMTAA